jgi:L-ascorbate metabolism protein UlaG (beta-lactamase superfamily)
MRHSSLICGAVPNKENRLQTHVAALLAASVGAIASSCSGPLLVSDGNILAITRSQCLASGHATADPSALQIRWLGTACYLVRWGDVVLMTDPFFTHQSLERVAFGSICSNPAVVERKTHDLARPQAIFVGHSHYDHLLDLAESVRQRAWNDVPIFGSQSVRNLLCGYGESLAGQCREPATDGHWCSVGPGLEYKAFLTEHAPQVDGILLYAGRVERPLTRPPARAREFKVGETYAYVFRLSRGDQQFTLYFAGAVATAPAGFPDESVQTVDLAILCVPGWRNAKEYPQGIIRRLRPRHILLAHYDDFFQTDGRRTREVPTADLVAFIRVVQDAADYPEFESILVPGVNAVVQVAARSSE